MTPAELAAIRERAEAATPGPWTERRNDDEDNDFLYSIDGADGQPIVKADCGVYPPDKEDATFIAAARSDVPALLDEVERLERDLRRAPRDFVADYIAKHWPPDGDRPSSPPAAILRIENAAEAWTFVRRSEAGEYEAARAMARAKLLSEGGLEANEVAALRQHADALAGALVEVMGTNGHWCESTRKHMAWCDTARTALAAWEGYKKGESK